MTSCIIAFQLSPVVILNSVSRAMGKVSKLLWSLMPAPPLFGQPEKKPTPAHAQIKCSRTSRMPTFQQLGRATPMVWMRRRLALSV